MATEIHCKCGVIGTYYHLWVQGMTLFTDGTVIIWRDSKEDRMWVECDTRHAIYSCLRCRATDERREHDLKQEAKIEHIKTSKPHWWQGFWKKQPTK